MTSGSSSGWIRSIGTKPIICSGSKPNSERQTGETYSRVSSGSFSRVIMSLVVSASRR